MINAQALFNYEMPKILAWYRWFHQNPELSNCEENTGKKIIEILTEQGITNILPYAKTGLVCDIQGNKKGKHIAFRAELDALPIIEKTNVDYSSKNKGVMHSCGHDFHIATLLGLASVLNNNKDKFEGRITFVFQPSEEQLPGGAKQMLEEGLFLNDKPDLMIAQHVAPELTTGTVGFRVGSSMASGDEIEIIIRGKGGHGASPHQSNDVVLTLAQVIVALQQVKSRFIPANMPFVLSFGKIEALGATNILPNEAIACGTMRTLNEKWREKAKKHITGIVANISEMYGCTGETKIKTGYPVLNNDERLTECLSNFAKNLLSEANVIELPVRMGTDDFSYFAQVIPSVYFRTGVAPLNANDISGLHTDTFLPDTSAFSTVLNLLLSFILNNRI